MKKQPEVTAATRQAIIDAFWMVYENKRIEQIRIREVADLAHVHRITFYEYFTDIYDLLAQEEEVLIREIAENAPQLQSIGMDEAIKQIAEIYMREGKRLCLLIGEGGDPQFLHRFKTVLFPAFQKMKSLPNLEAVSVVYEFAVNGLIMAFYSWYTNKERMETSEFVKIARSLIENGIPKTLEIVTNR